MPLQLVVAIPTFVCSLLSLLADTTFAVFYVLFPPERHFRQALIVNLLISDWINSLNNTISGALALSRRHHEEALEPGPACTANGYIGQFSVQAIDFNILVISLAVLLTVRQSRLTIEPPWWQVAVVCAIPWIPPLITANVALGLDAYGPVSGNWCWIKENLLWRYTLTHGWRIAIFFVTIGIYTYVYIYLKRVYGKLHISAGSSGSRDVNEEDQTELRFQDRRHIHIRSTITAQAESDEMPLQPIPAEDEQYFDPGDRNKQIRGPATHVEAIVTETPAERARKKTLRKMLLLNGYPILYILLWIPGIANRIVEIVGVSPTWLKALQATTQLVGFANALTYAWSEQLSGRVRGWWRYKRRNKGSGRTVRLAERDIQSPL